MFVSTIRSPHKSLLLFNYYNLPRRLTRQPSKKNIWRDICVIPHGSWICLWKQFNGIHMGLYKISCNVPNHMNYINIFNMSNYKYNSNIHIIFTVRANFLKMYNIYQLQCSVFHQLPFIFIIIKGYHKSLKIDIHPIKLFPVEFKSNYSGLLLSLNHISISGSLLYSSGGVISSATQ